MIGRSHSPISSLDGQDQALKIPVGVVTLVSDVPRGGGALWFTPAPSLATYVHCKFETHWIQDGRP